MAVELEKLIVELSANTRGLDREMKRTRTDFQRRLDEMEKSTTRFAGRMSSAADKAGKSFSVVGSSLRTGLGFAAAQAGLNGVEGALRRLSQVADLGDLSEKVGISTDAIQSLQFMALETGGSIEGLNAGLIRFSRNMADAGTKTGELYEVLKLNKVSIRDNAGNLVSAEEAIRRYADIVAKAKNPQEALEFATRAFGKAAGEELVGMLSQGRAGIDQFVKRAKDVGAVVDTDMIKKFQELDDKIKQLGYVINSSLVGAITNFGSIMAKILNTIEEIGKRLGAPEFVRWAGQVISPPSGTGTRLNPGSISGRPNSATLPSRVDQRLDPQYGVATMGGGTFNDVFSQGGAGFRGQLSPPPRATTTRIDPDRSTDFTPPPPKPPGTSILPGATRTGKSEAEKEAEAYKRLLDNTRERIEALKIEQATLGMSEGAAAAYRTEQELLNDAMRDEITLTPKRREEIAALAAQMGEATTATENAIAAQERLKEALEKVADTSADVFRGFLEGMQQGASGAEILRSALGTVQSALNDVLADMFRANLLKTLTSAFGGVGGIPTMAQGGYGPDIPGRAIGGPVSAGRPYMVGERGPELMVPTTAGHVVPNGKFGSQPVNVQFQVVNNTSSRVTQREESDGKGGRRMVAVIDEAVAGAMARPGSVSGQAAMGLGRITRR